MTHRLTPVERIKLLLREEEALQRGSPSSSREGTPYSHISQIEVDEERNAVYRVASFVPAQAVEITAFPKRAELDIKHELVQEVLEEIGFYSMPEIVGRVNRETFEHCHNIYENNQLHFLEGIESKVYTKEQAKEYLSRLEEWFLCIVEPEPELDSEWFEREIMSKYKYGYTTSCLEDARSYIKVRPEVFSYLRYLHGTCGYAV